MQPSTFLKESEQRLGAYNGDARTYARWSKKARMMIGNLDIDWLNALDYSKEDHLALARSQVLSVSLSSVTESSSTSSTSSTNKMKKASQSSTPASAKLSTPSKMAITLDTDKESKLAKQVDESRRKVAFLLTACLTGEAVDLITEEEAFDPHTVWIVLRDAAKGITIGSRSSRHQKLWQTRFQDSHSALHIVTQLKILMEGLDMKDDAKIGALQTLLPPRFAGFSDLIDSMSAPSFTEVTRILMSKDSTMSNRQVSKKHNFNAEPAFGVFGHWRWRRWRRWWWWF